MSVFILNVAAKREQTAVSCIDQGIYWHFSIRIFDLISMLNFFNFIKRKWRFKVVIPPCGTSFPPPPPPPTAAGNHIILVFKPHTGDLIQLCLSFLHYHAHLLFYFSFFYLLSFICGGFFFFYCLPLSYMITCVFSSLFSVKLFTPVSSECFVRRLLLTWWMC